MAWRAWISGFLSRARSSSTGSAGSGWGTRGSAKMLSDSWGRLNNCFQPRFDLELFPMMGGGFQQEFGLLKLGLENLVLATQMRLRGAMRAEGLRVVAKDALLLARTQ